MSIVSSVSAQSIDIPALLSSDLNASPTTATLRYSHQFRADVEDAGTEVARQNAFLGLGHRVRLGGNTMLFTRASYALHNYEFSGIRGPTQFFGWDDVHRMVISGVIAHDVSAGWRILGGVLFRSWGEGGADYADSLTGGAFFGFNYHTGRDISVGLVMRASQRARRLREIPPGADLEMEHR